MTGAAWVFALLVFATVIMVVAERGEIRTVFQLLRRVRPVWLFAAGALQALTYVMAAAIWRVALNASGQRQSLRSLMVLALAMLFSNQALPSVGISGGLVVADALVRRGVPKPVAMSALLVGLVTTYAAFLVALLVTLARVNAFGSLTAAVRAVTVAFSLMAGSVTVVIFECGRLPSAWRDRLSRLPIVGHALTAIVAAPTDVLRRGAVMLGATLLQFVEIAFDAATLGVSLLALGWSLSPSAVFGSYVVASVASRVAFAPLGIGTFEAASVTMLHVAGVPLEPALAATLIFRGFTLWLPMVPGVWSARRVLRST